MSEMDQNDKDLLAAILSGKSEAWSQLIEQYQGSLLNFAKSRLPQHADAEDVVQNTFVSLIKGLNDFRGESSLGNYLFAILRNNIYNNYRTKQAKSVCLLQDIYADHTDDALDSLRDDSTPSQYLWRGEQKQLLAQTIQKVLTKYKVSMKFENLKMTDLLFYGKIHDKTTAKLLGLKPSKVRVFKYRLISEIHKNFMAVCPSSESDMPNPESLLTEIWESQRLSCPKRNTIAAFLSETLDAKWFDYVDFHITTLGCHFCRAELKDMMNTKTSDHDQLLKKQILASTVGFLNK